MPSAQETEYFDLISLGTGEAGKYIAWMISSAQGKHCAAIERQYYGGSCPNVACLPSKNVIWSAKVANLCSHGETFGLWHKYGASTVDTAAMKRRKQGMIDGLIQLHKENFKKTGVEVVWGDGKFVGPKTIEVIDKEGGKRRLEADTVIVSTSSRAPIPGIEGLEEASPLTHVEMLNVDELPEDLIVIGAGYVGLELA